MAKYLFGTVFLLAWADPSTTVAQACGGSFNDIGDDFSMWDPSSGWQCQQVYIDYWWNAFDFDEGDWDDGMGYTSPCSNLLPLARTFNAMWHLGYVGTGSPNCNTSALNKTLWAQCWAASKTDEVDSSCATDDNATAHGCQNCIGDCRTVLKKGFFYSNNPARRASILFHEARHTGGSGCGHNAADSSCDRGRSCEYSWEHGCEEFTHPNENGANSYQVLYIESYVFYGWRTTPTMKSSMVSLGNVILDNAYDNEPCKNMTSNGLIFPC